jgi:HopA1 effector protein family
MPILASKVTITIVKIELSRSSGAISMNYIQPSIQEAIELIEIDADLTIAHPDYEPLELSPELADRFDRLSPRLQTRCLISQYSNYLYDLFFTREWQSNAELEAQEQSPAIENSDIDGIDVEFGYTLHENNLGSGYLDPGWQIIEITEDRTLGATKNELTLYLTPERDLPPHHRDAKVGDTVSIHLPKNLVGQDTYIAVGSEGMPSLQYPTLDFYFNLTPTGAVALLRECTTKLDRLAIPFTLSILHHPDLYHRCDTATLRFAASNYDKVQPLAIDFCQQHQPECRSILPMFVLPLAQGLGMGELPLPQDNFGLHRCELVAEAIVESYLAGQQSIEDKITAVERVFTESRFFFDRPHIDRTNILGELPE